MFQCVKCFHKFTLKDKSWIEKAYEDYTIHKQTYSELEVKYSKSEDIIRKYFDELQAQNLSSSSLVIDLEPINLIFDTTFFKRSFGVMVFRKIGKNISWKYVKTEKLSFYLEELFRLKKLDLPLNPLQ